jgi:competence protein ComEA
MNIIKSIVLALSLAPLLAWAAPVNINTADVATLARELKGIGETRARAIVEHRNQHGPFRSVDELALVKGIGQKVIDRNRDVLRVDREARAPVAAVAPAATRPKTTPALAPTRH